MNETSTINWSLILIIAGVLAAGFVFSAIGARLTAVAQEDSRGRRVSAGSGIGFLMFVVLIIGGILFMGMFYQSTRREQQIETATLLQDSRAMAMARREQAGREAELRGEENRPGAESEVDESASALPLPDWTKTPVVIVEKGEVDLARLVAESQFCATREEAIEDATVVALATFHDRFAEDWPEVGAWTLPLDLFQAESILGDPWIETQMFNIAGETGPMYRAFIQFEDSPKVRERFLTRWRSEVADTRAGQYALGLGGIGLGLGLISALLRSALAISGRQRASAESTV